MLSLTGHNYIGGERRAAGTVEHKSLDASSGEALPYTFIQATPEEVDAAAQAAAAAYPTYRNLSAVRRAEFLEAIADEIDALGDDFVALVCRETALPAARIQASVVVQVARCVCSPRCCVVVTSTVHGSTAPCRIASRCRARICVSTRSASSGRRVRCQQLPAGLLHRGWRYRLGSGCRLPGGVQGAQRPHGHCRVRG